MAENTFANGKLQKMYIQAYKPTKKDEPLVLSEAEEDKYIVQVNPESYKMDYIVRYDKEAAQGNSGSEAKFAKTLPPTLEFEFLFDGTGAIPVTTGELNGVPTDGAPAKPARQDQRQLYDVMQELKNFAQVVDFNGKEHKPRKLRLAWGKLIFDCVLSGLSVEYKLFKPDGTPLRAIAKASFTGTISDKLRELKEGRTSADLTHLRTVTAGDKLPLMADKIYGSPKHYIQVARVNKLYNFRKLKAGTTLSFPPIDKKSK
jgi:hypothetical protein